MGRFGIGRRGQLPRLRGARGTARRRTLLPLAWPAPRGVRDAAAGVAGLDSLRPLPALALRHLLRAVEEGLRRAREPAQPARLARAALALHRDRSLGGHP